METNEHPYSHTQLSQLIFTFHSLVHIVLVLGEALEGWDAVETELRAAVAGKEAEELDWVRTATQVSL